VSIKLYTGIRFQETRFEDLHTRMMAIRPALAQDMMRRCREAILNIAVHRFDHECLCGEKPQKIMSRAIDLFRDEAVRANQGQRAAFDFAFNVTVMPCRGRFFGLHFGNHQIAQQFLALSGAEDFHYQDQSDQPEEVSDSEWAERKNTWEQIFEASSGWIPSEVGANFDLIPETPTYYYGEREAFAAQMPVVDRSRFERQAREDLMDAVMSGNVPESGLIDTKSIAGAHAKARAWLGTPQGLARLRLEIDHLAQFLKERVSFEDLWPVPA